MTDPGLYEVHNSAATAAEFLALVREATAHGIRRETLRAAQWATEELARTPNEFGESREYLVEIGLQIRCAYVGPLQIEFGVDELRRVVIYRRFSKSGW